ncbi:MAG TPA: hypothetical protein VML55_12510 [Planctomycetaceae bacterium]|nr:hypothetical protein [Planctomycetaceae bacterium]
MDSWGQADRAPAWPEPAAPAGGGPRESGGAAGRWVVLGMLAFGLLATGGLWLYWDLHTRPFRELQEALVREFPGSNPRVQGGQPKKHQRAPRILQVVMRVGFDPVAGESEANRMAVRVAELARRHHDVTHYEIIEIGLFQPLAEQEPKMRAIRIGSVTSPAP